ncbi:hypothetical protein BN6_79810 [Saccharothrix espanaensis DSM 44229]|uniref:Uncharacterized protein n=1 Tax=Saccharothrix espanaensis (strain ATCC 51144 / DSM 44229 / JCM 9112 / NBRC 15066 / NRRL 15764) TaxID=1179773 RepID=K0KEK8_SACES|nr:hypothetical protein BN6_79810 [Saccharothrix espanaensis DSM 44229]
MRVGPIFEQLHSPANTRCGHLTAYALMLGGRGAAGLRPEPERQPTRAAEGGPVDPPRSRTSAQPMLRDTPWREC